LNAAAEGGDCSAAKEDEFGFDNAAPATSPENIN